MSSLIAGGLLPSIVCAQALLPGNVQRALADAQIKDSQMSVSVVDLDNQRAVLQWQASRRVLPASSIKIVTTLAALDVLGPAFQWKTRFYHDGQIQNGRLNGNLYFVGGGDPRYVAEHLWRDSHAIKSLGIKEIVGDIIVDRSLFALGSQKSFDDQTHRPYNLGADAALFNFNSMVVRFLPDEQRKVAYVSALPLQEGLKLPAFVAMKPGWCRGWRQQLKADVRDPLKPTFQGSFVQGCGERSLTYVVADRDRFLKQAFRAQFKETGIRWRGQVKSGELVANAKPLLESASDDMATTVRLTNKFSNNILARHLFLSLAMPEKKGLITYEDARQRLSRWLVESVKLEPQSIVVDNGSGLSRKSAVTAEAMTKVLTYGFRSAYGFEWVSSFPIAGLDGTMKHRPISGATAHIKTGLLNEVKTMAGIVRTEQGKHYAVFASLEGKNANLGDKAMDALLHWVAQR